MPGGGKADVGVGADEVLSEALALPLTPLTNQAASTISLALRPG